jgi:transcriptional regulator with XRE-family HTH domain
MNSFGERLLYYRKKIKGISQGVFSEKCGKDSDGKELVSQANITQWERNEGKPSSTKMKAIEKAFPDLNFDWLLSGKGEIQRSGYPKPIATSTGKELEEIKRLLRENDELKVYKEKYIELQERYVKLLEKVHNLKK